MGRNEKKWELEGVGFSGKLKANMKYLVPLLVIAIVGVSAFLLTRGGGQTGAPVASFTYSTTASTVSFTDTSTDPDGTVVSWSWSFGDGSTSTLKNPTHQYTTSGTYSVILIVTDDDGNTDVKTWSVTVTVPTNLSPTASFTYSPSSPTTASTVSFTDASTDPDGTVVSWSWSFGDGTTSTQQNPTHQYTTASTYTARLVVTDDDGATDTYSRSITVTSEGGPGPTEFTVYGDVGTGQGLDEPAWYDGGDDSPDSAPWTIDQSEVSGGYSGDPSTCWKVQYTNGSGYWGGFYVAFSSATDMSSYSNLTFYVKGESGGELFKLSIRDSFTASGSEPTVLSGGYTTVTTSWQKVTIPLSAFTGQSTSSIIVAFNICFSDDYTGGNATVYIDLVRWE